MNMIHRGESILSIMLIRANLWSAIHPRFSSRLRRKQWVIYG